VITISNLSKNFHQRSLFKDVSLSIFKGEKIGLTGPNGSGKTTLFSIILGEMEISGGHIQIQKNINIGYLPQEAQFKSQQTVIEEVTSGDQRIQALLREKRKLEDNHQADSMRYGDILEALETLDFYELEHKAAKILSGLGFSEDVFDKPVAQLSGGWQMRTLLAKLLVYPYGLLLLDEPTNYLDLAATLWLKDFLARYDGTFVVISHDRIFLNDVTNYTIVLDNAQIIKVKGNYEAYEQQKEIDQRTLEKKQKVIEKKREQLEKFTQRFHAQPNRAAAVRNKRKMIERLEQIELPSEKKSIKDFEFPPAPSSGYSVIRMEGINKSFGEQKVYESLKLEITRGQKVCLVGPNGAGKSTLLKMAAGVLQPDRGEMRLGRNVERGYFSQTRLDVLNSQRNVLDELASASRTSVPMTQMRSLLGLFNFHGEDVFKPVQVLSGGEKSRLILAKLLIAPPNFILLDEPTTHLDLDGVKALTRAFQEYQGTLCFISHDLYFVQQVAGTIIEIEGGRLKTFPGGLDYYLLKKEQGHTLGRVKEKQVRQEKQVRKAEKKKDKEKENKKLQAARETHKKALRRLNEIKQTIKKLQEEKQALETESYAKARFMSNAFGKNKEVLQEHGRRLKEITGLLRDIESRIKKLEAERERISK